MSSPHRRSNPNTLVGARIDGADASLEARIGSRIERHPDGCWLYNDKRDQYVVLPQVGGGLHRWVYETLVGPIDEGLHLHHECRNPGCCNPAHLLPLTPKEHKARHKQLDAC